MVTRPPFPAPAHRRRAAPRADPTGPDPPEPALRGPSAGGGHVEGEAERRDPEPDGPGGLEAPPTGPAHTTVSPNTTARAQADDRAGTVSCWAAAAGMTSRANTSRAPVIWLTSAAVHPSTTRNSHRQGAGRARPGRRRRRRSTVANSRGRPTTARTARTTTATTTRATTWPSDTPEERAEQQSGDAVEEAAVEADEQRTVARANAWTVPMTADSWLRARPDARSGHQGDHQGGGDAAGEVAGRRAHPEPDGGGRARGTTPRPGCGRRSSAAAAP